MATLKNDQIVVKGREPKPDADFATLRKAANEQSPVSTIDPEKYAKGK